MNSQPSKSKLNKQLQACDSPLESYGLFPFTEKKREFAVNRPLSPEEHALIEKLSGQVKAYARRVGFDEPEETAPEIDPDTGEVIEPLN